MKHYFTLICSVVLMFGVSILVSQAELVGHWTFEPGEELKDLTGNFGDVELRDATVADGQLHIGEDKWAITTGYAGPDISEKTLFAAIYLDDLDVSNGAPLGINKSSADQFDAIVYAEREERRWMAGSSFWRRTEDAVPGFEETETGQLIELSISYEGDGTGQAHITIYRNGEIIGDYTKGPLVTWEAGDTEAIFGPRAVIGGTAHGWVIARVEEARIYNEVLSQDEIITSVDFHDKLTTLWVTIKAK